MKTKYIIPSFAFYDRTGIQRYLEKQAAKGWMLDKAGNYCWRFRRMEPNGLRFCVTYFPKADLYDPAPSEAEQTFRDFCAHGGWILAGSNAQMQIFWSDAPNPMPIETDPVMEVENIHRSMKKGMLMAYWLLLVNCLIQFVSQGISLSQGLVNFLSNGLNLWLAGTWILLFILAAARLLMYYGWRRKARRAAEADGIFVETKSIMWAENLAALLIFGGITAMILTLEDRRMAAVLGCCIALAIVLIIGIELFRRWMKRKGFDAADSKKYTMIVTVVLALLLFFGGIPAVTYAVMNDDGYEQAQTADLLLDIRDLLGEEAAEYKTMLLTSQESPFLGYQRIYQYPEGSRTIPHLEYNRVDVKADFLYDVSLEEIMTIPVYMTEGTFRSIDPAPWGAEQAWQLHDGEELRNWYVLCYEDTILEMLPSWELTAEQMAAVGELLK